MLRVGAALELFQAAALFHDDVMDDSDTRRGFPAAHRAFARLHADHGLTGDAERFGMSAAILLGDLTLIASEQEFAGALALQPLTRAERARAVFDLMRTEVTVGQYLDVLAQALPWGDDPGRRRGARARGHPHQGRPVQRRAPDRPRRRSRRRRRERARRRAARSACRWARRSSCATTCSGVFGDPRTTGKPSGDDLREGKRTILTARAVARARAGVRRGHGGAAAHAARRPCAHRRRRRRARRGHPGHGRPGRRRASSSTTWPGARSPCMDERPWAEPARSQLIGLAHAAVDRHA